MNAAKVVEREPNRERLAARSREAATRNWNEFRNDPEWKKVAAESEANGKILANPPESVFMDPADFSQIK